VVVHRARRILRAIAAADRIAALVAEPAGDRAAAEFAGAEVVDGVADIGFAAYLRASLADFVVMPGRFDQASAFPDVVAHRLFDVDMLAGLHGPDRGEGVPVVGRGDGDGGNLLGVREGAKV